MSLKKIENKLISNFGERKGLFINKIFTSLLISIWIMFVTFPIMVIKVNTIDKVIEWRWIYMLYVGIGTFFISLIWRRMLNLKELKLKTEGSEEQGKKLAEKIGSFSETVYYKPTIALVAVGFVIFPIIASMYQTTIMSTALIYVMLGLGLNIVVGLGGMLNLGYVAFYAVGAYTYGLLFHYFGLSFWIALPIAALFSTIFGILVAFPVLRLRGDYLAIVTLAFAEITRLVIENWGSLTLGPSGIKNIAAPGFFGIKMKLPAKMMAIYYIILIMAVLTIIVIYRLENSRIGRAWQALREDEIATRAMGINVSVTKLTAFALGATWAGFAGVLFAAKTTFINPQSFTIWESIIILCFVVLGGMGSIFGVALAAIVLTLLPESLRMFSEYRMIVYGAVLVIMMIFRPGGFIDVKRRHYKINKTDLQSGE